MGKAFLHTTINSLEGMRPFYKACYQMSYAGETTWVSRLLPEPDHSSTFMQWEKLWWCWNAVCTRFSSFILPPISSSSFDGAAAVVYSSTIVLTEMALHWNFSYFNHVFITIRLLLDNLKMAASVVIDLPLSLTPFLQYLVLWWCSCPVTIRYWETCSSGGKKWNLLKVICWYVNSLES